MYLIYYCIKWVQRFQHDHCAVAKETHPKNSRTFQFYDPNKIRFDCNRRSFGQLVSLSRLALY